MKILIISDLHIGPTARCATMIPMEERTGKEMDAEYIKHFEDIVNKQNPPIDYMIICGDITNTATAAQFAHFDEVVEKLLAASKLDADKLFITAGNHDYDRTHLPEEKGVEIDEVTWRSRYAPLNSSKYLSGRIADSEGELTEDPYYCRWQDDNIYTVTINTAAHEKPSDDVKSGYISADTLERVQAQLENDGIAHIDKAKILLIHHHPVNYPNLASDWKDYSMLQCHDDIVDFACRNSIDLIIHGHRHQPRFKSDLTGDGDQITIIASGSFSQRLPYSVYDLVSNQLHILEIDERDHESRVLKGTIHNFAFTHTKGWRESKLDGDGIDHRISFGPNEHKAKLYAAGKPYIQNAVETTGHCKVRDLINDNAPFEHKSNEVITSVIEKICAELDYELFGDNILNTVILKKEDA